MKAKKVVAGLVSAVYLMGLGSVAMASEKVNAEAFWWNTNLDAKAKVGDTGTNINFKDDLGMDGKNLNEFRLTFGDEKKMRIAYTNWKFTGQETLSQTIEFDGQTYIATTDVASKLDIKYYRVGFIRPLSHNDTTKLDYMIDIKGFNFDTALDSDTANVHSKKSFSGALPTIGIAAITKLDRSLSAYGEVSGLPFGKYGHIYDAEAGLKYTPNSQTTITAAYRAFDLKAKDDSDYAQVKLTGPYFGLEYKF